MESSPPSRIAGNAARPSENTLPGSGCVPSRKTTPASPAVTAPSAQARVEVRTTLTPLNAASRVLLATARIRSPTRERCRPMRITTNTAAVRMNVNRSSGVR